VKLTLERIIASGTFGWVCVVRDQASGQQLAAKVLHSEHVTNPKVVARMRDEARLLSHLDHPNIVRVFGIEEMSGRPVLLLEYVPGAALDELVSQHPAGLPAPEACEIARQAHQALHAAWTAKADGRPLRVIHRDIKPSNLILSVDGDVKILDFGIAKGEMVGKEAVTVSMVLGAHGYLAPERLDGEDDRIEGDVFAMGHVLYELLSGRFLKLSLQRKQHDRRLEEGLRAMVPQGADADTAQRLRALLWRMLAYAPEQRPDHPAVVQQLSAVMARARWSPNLPRWARAHAGPLEQARYEQPVVEHPQYEALRFLESSKRAGWLSWAWG
jgi:serine/threonine protein kinase